MNQADTHSEKGLQFQKANYRQRRFELVILLLVLLAAAVVRLWHLSGVPPGLTHDEAGHGHDAIAILEGARPIYQTVGYGREPLYDYLVAGLMGLTTSSGLALRLAAVLLGMATLALTFFWVRQAFDGTTALVALAFQAASFWSLATSRQGLRSGLLPVLFTAAVFVYWRFILSPETSATDSTIPLTFNESERRPYWQTGLFALLIGATLYTYMPARVLWLLFPAFLVYLALFHRPLLRRVWLPTLLGVLIGLLLAVPMFNYLRTHPGAEERLNMLDEPLQALKRGDVSVVLNRAGSTLAGFLVPGRGDDFIAYNLPGRPVFDVLSGTLFLIGLGLCVLRWHKPSAAFALLWFLIGISPSLVTGVSASTTRNIAALPVTFLFPAIAAVTGARWVGRRGNKTLASLAYALVALVVLAYGALSAYDYFVRWGESRDVRAAYQHTLVEAAETLDTPPPPNAVAFSTLYPRAPHDPYIVEVASQQRDVEFHWFDGQHALLLPPAAAARLIVLASAPLDAYFAELPGFDAQQRFTQETGDLDPFFDVYEWEPSLTLKALRARMTDSALSLPLPVNFGHTLQLLGYDLRTPVVTPGGTVELITLWQVLDPHAWQAESLDLDAELVLFTHALDASQSIVGQADRLDAPAWDWQEQDIVAQLHRFSIDADPPPEPIVLEVGVYRSADLTRLPVILPDRSGEDRVLLAEVEVKTP